MTYGEDSKRSWISPQNRLLCGWITHFTKGSQGKNLTERVLGSGGFGHVARLVIAGGQNEETTV